MLGLFCIPILVNNILFYFSFNIMKQENELLKRNDKKYKYLPVTNEDNNSNEDNRSWYRENFELPQLSFKLLFQFVIEMTIVRGFYSMYN